MKLDEIAQYEFYIYTINNEIYRELVVQDSHLTSWTERSIHKGDYHLNMRTTDKEGVQSAYSNDLLFSC